MSRLSEIGSCNKWTTNYTQTKRDHQGINLGGLRIKNCAGALDELDFT